MHTAWAETAPDRFWPIWKWKKLIEKIIDEYFETLSIQGIDIEEIYNELIDEGLSAFKDAFNEILTQLGE